MNWKTRAKKVEPSESPELPKWKEEAKLVEEKRQANVERGAETREQILENAKEFFTPPKLEHLGISAAQGATLSFADEIAGGLSAAWQKASGDKRPYSEIYKEVRDAVRGKTSEAREQSPVTSFVAEILGSAPYGGSGIMRRAATGAAIGAGEAKEVEDVPSMSAIGGALGGTSEAITKAVGSMFKDPNILRARYTGATPKEFERVGLLGDPEKSAEFLDKTGFFKNKSAEFSPEKMSFVPTKKGGFPSRQEALKRAKDAINKLGEYIQSKISKKSPDFVIEGVPSEGVYSWEDFIGDESLLDDVNNYLSKVYGQKEANAAAEKTMNKFLEEIGEGSTLSDIQRIKQNLMASIAEGYKKQDPDLVDLNMKKIIANRLKNFITEQMGEEGADIAHANEIMHNLFNVKTTLSKKVSAEKAGMNRSNIPAFGQIGYKVQRGMEILGGGEKGLLSRARGAEIIDSIPEGIKRPARMTPLQIIKGAEEDYGREPQSIPESIVRTPLPRDTDRILEGKDFVLAKAAQQAPEMFDHVREVLENNPEVLPDILPGLVNGFPQLFERDQYNRVDGKIIDPAMREKARKDTMMREDLSKIEKAIIINELNKTGIFHDN